MKTIIELAEECGLLINSNDRSSTSNETSFLVEDCYFDIERFVELIRADEREVVGEQLAQQQEPVAWIPITNWRWNNNAGTWEGLTDTSPPAQRTWVGLTDDEIEKELGPFPLWISNWDHWDIMNFATAIEAKLKEKNT